VNTVGQLALLIALVGTGYAAFALVMGRHSGSRAIARSGDAAAAASVAALTVVTAVLARALVVKDFSLAYVAEYSSRLLPWHYSLSALWVGQAGSLLVWAWLMGVVTMAYRFWPRRSPSPLGEFTLAVLMAYLACLVAVMVFGADPMEPSLATPRDGAGLSPSLQHPAMLIHPPIVFLGYTGWAIPFALTLAALLSGRIDTAWVREARRWALFAWVVLGGGILLGALWAYEELGWGGYWAWDPVENGSLIPWLTGTAMVHTLMAWQYRGLYKKTTLVLAIATFGLCNFATFLTRSGLFSSLHAFSQSPVGWMFLVLMLGLVLGGGVLIVLRRSMLRGVRPISSLWARESFVLLAVIALVLLAAVALAGTMAVPLSAAILGRAIVVGTPFYNNVLIPTGLLLLATTAAAPLLTWGKPPTAGKRRVLALCAVVAAAATVLALSLGVRNPIALAVTWLAASALTALVGALALDAAARGSGKPWLGLFRALRGSRREYSGFLIHAGFVCLAVGVTGSSLGTRREALVMRPGQTVQWAGRSIRFVELTQQELPDKLVGQARLEVSHGGGAPDTLLPAQHLHFLQGEWTTEVAIHSTWGGDLYTILQGGEEDGSVRLTFVENPLMRWIWLGGWLMGAGAVGGLWPAGRRAARPPDDARSSPGIASRGHVPSRVPAPHRKPKATRPNLVSD
jgi:cytochrome c-type biogenesis protein CcmF